MGVIEYLPLSNSKRFTNASDLSFSVFLRTTELLPPQLVNGHAAERRRQRERPGSSRPALRRAAGARDQ